MDKTIYKKAFREKESKLGNPYKEAYFTSEVESDYDPVGCLNLALCVLESCFLKSHRVQSYLLDETKSVNRKFAAGEGKLIEMTLDCVSIANARQLRKWILDINTVLEKDAKRPVLSYDRKYNEL